MERIPEIDGLRALAALSVFAHHVFGYPSLVRITGAGWIGVDLFFVISGYLITTILIGMRDDPHYFRNFYVRRSLRIFPPYYSLFALCLVYAMFDRSYHFSGRLWTAYALYATSLIAIQPWYFGAESHLPGPARAIEVTWSLSIEELFYVLWAPAVRFLKRRHLEILVLSIIAMGPLIRWYVHTPGARTEYFFFPARMDTLAFGALLALIRDRLSILLPAWPVAIGLISSASILFLVADPETNAWFAVFGYSVIALSMALVLAFVLDHAGSTQVVCKALRSRLLVRLGTISYMFYLLHLFVIKSFRGIFAHLLLSQWALNRIVQVIGSLVVTVLLASLSWKYFESPILRFKERFGTPRTKPASIVPAVEQLEPAVSEGLA
jgi:peptidoglycan/LPS O-acetylase OafA/YrhL